MITVTASFLFTDIEGSTRLWEREPEPMRLALARHDQLLREVIEQNGGSVFKTIGDAFCAVFSDPHDGVRAMVLAQRALGEEPWPTSRPLRVRMALHTGVAECRDQDYFGPPLNRTARLLSTGHGGQALLSLATSELVRDQLDPTLQLRDLGQYRLKDLTRPEQIFQVVAPGLAERFPALKSLESFPNNLPQQVTSFLGREEELRTVAALLTSSRLVTLTGSGGCGKSRLALQLGADLLESYPDGVWFAELASVTSPTLVAQVIAGAIGITDLPGDATQALCRTLHDRKLLLILDNCEHLIEACARLVTSLLQACPQLTILATSREALQVSGEQHYRVPSLSLPTRHPPPGADKLSQFTAVQLFVERAQAVQADFSVTNANAPYVAEICWRLDGIPLAIELAAARLRNMGIEDLFTRIEKSFGVIGGSNRTAPSRQQTLRALIDWSYNLLSENEQLLLSRLSVFVDGWTLEAAEGVCAGEAIEEWEVLDLLSSLVDKSLVLLDAGRYKMLETIKQYAQEKALPEAELLRERHMQWFVDWVRAGFEDILYRGIHTRAYQQISEVDNIRQALRQANQANKSEAALVLAGLSRFIWSVDGRNVEGIQELHAALNRVQNQPDSILKGLTMTSLSMLYRTANQREPSYQWGLKALSIHQSLEDKLAMADVLYCLGGLNELSDGDRAFAVQTRDWLLEAVTLHRAGGNSLFASSCQHLLGQWHLFQNELEEAERYFEKARHDIIAFQDWINEGPMEDCFAELRYRQGRLEESDAGYRTAIQINARNQNMREVALQLVSMGRNAGAHGSFARAVRLLGAAESHHRRYFLDYNPVSKTDADATLVAARQQLAPVVLERELQAGRALSTVDAVTFALSEDSP